MIIVYVVTLFCYINLSQGHGTPTILEEPESRYILTGNNASFNCNTQSHNTYWIINDRFLPNAAAWSTYYNPLFFHFNEPNVSTEGTHFYNLSLTIIGNNETHLTSVACKAYVGSLFSISHDATLYVFDTFIPPPPPNISVQQINNTLQLGLSSPYHWADFEASEYNITLRNSDDVSFSYALSTTNVFPLIIGFETSVNTLPLDLQFCSKYTLSVTAVSPAFGLSVPSHFEFVTPSQEMPAFEVVNTTVYFNSIGAPFLTLFAELNEDGFCHLLNYTYIIHLRTSNHTVLTQIGPKPVAASGLISEILIGGLEANTQYTAQLKVSVPFDSTIFSKVYTFETIRKDKFTCEPPTAGHAAEALGVLCAVLTVLLLLVTIVCVCILKQKSRNPKSTRSQQSSDPMVTNPIYGGPVYETVHQGYNPLSSSGSTTPDSVSSPTTPLNADSSRYNTNPTSRTDILDLVRRSTLPTQPNGRVVSPLAGTSYRSSSISGNATVKHPPRERNKLHLTLSLGNERVPNNPEVGTSTQEKGGSGKVQWGKEDENYTIMSPAANRGFGSSINGGWGEVSPEPSSKSQE